MQPNRLGRWVLKRGRGKVPTASFTTLAWRRGIILFAIYMCPYITWALYACLPLWPLCVAYAIGLTLAPSVNVTVMSGDLTFSGLRRRGWSRSIVTEPLVAQEWGQLPFPPMNFGLSENCRNILVSENCGLKMQNLGLKTCIMVKFWAQIEILNTLLENCSCQNSVENLQSKNIATFCPTCWFNPPRHVSVQP